MEAIDYRNIIIFNIFVVIVVVVRIIGFNFTKIDIIEVIVVGVGCVCVSIFVCDNFFYSWERRREGDSCLKREVTKKNIHMLNSKKKKKKEKK